MDRCSHRQSDPDTLVPAKLKSESEFLLHLKLVQSCSMCEESGGRDESQEESVRAKYLVRPLLPLILPSRLTMKQGAADVVSRRPVSSLQD